MNDEIYYVIDREGRRFNLLRGYAEASVSDVKAIFEPVIEMVVKVSPPPAGDYFLAGCAPEDDRMAAVNHDLPPSACSCGVTAEAVQKDWLGFWTSIGLIPRDNLVLYNLKAIRERMTRITGQTGRETVAHLAVAAALAHELFHVKNHQRKMHYWQGEADAYAVQRDFIKRGAASIGLDATNKQIMLDETLADQRDHERNWREKHPDWKPSRHR